MVYAQYDNCASEQHPVVVDYHGPNISHILCHPKELVTLAETTLKKPVIHVFEVIRKQVNKKFAINCKQKVTK